jgi:hypothetical protein
MLLLFLAFKVNLYVCWLQVPRTSKIHSNFYGLVFVQPAQIAGCKTVVIATPPRKDGSLCPVSLCCQIGCRIGFAHEIMLLKRTCMFWWSVIVLFGHGCSASNQLPHAVQCAGRKYFTVRRSQVWHTSWKLVELRHVNRLTYTTFGL